MNDLSRLLQEEPQNVISEIDPEDISYRPERHDNYFLSGLSALRCIRVAMLAAGKEDPGSILDFACGSGRVLRVLKAAFPAAGLAACDINRPAVDFCARVFSARPIYSSEYAEEIQIEERFDLIWCGSLLTHLGIERWPGYLTLFERSLAPGGLVVFTTFGPYAAERLRRGEHPYDLDEAQHEAILADYDRDGFGYSDYPGEELSGVSLATPAFVCAQLGRVEGLRLVGYSEEAWLSGYEHRQDVVACVRDRG